MAAAGGRAAVAAAAAAAGLAAGAWAGGEGARCDGPGGWLPARFAGGRSRRSWHSSDADMALLDGSPQSLEAMRWGAHRLYEPGRKFILTHVVAHSSGVLAAGAGSLGHVVEAVEAAETAEDQAAVAAAREYMRACEAAAAEAGVAPADLESVVLVARGAGSGAIAEAVNAALDEKRVETVVLGSRGLGATRRRLEGLLGLGSLSSYLISELHANVLVVKQPARGGEAEERKEA